MYKKTRLTYGAASTGGEGGNETDINHARIQPFYGKPNNDTYHKAPLPPPGKAR